MLTSYITNNFQAAYSAVMSTANIKHSASQWKPREGKCKTRDLQRLNLHLVFILFVKKFQNDEGDEGEGADDEEEGDDIEVSFTLS